MKPPNLTRRDFLSLLQRGLLAASGLLGIGLLARYLGFQPEEEKPSQFDLGPLENYPPGSRIQVQQVAAVVVHSPQGWVAYSLVCPHLGCTVEVKEDGYACPCHGSRFDLSGNLRNGPAKQALTRLRLDTSADGHLILFTDQPFTD